MIQDLIQNPAVLHRAGLAAAALSIYAFWPYVRDILQGHTRPERSSWLIWSLLSAVSLLSQTYEGADKSLGFAAIQTAGTIVICLLTFWKSEGLRFKTEDSQVLTATAVGVWLWAEMETAAYAMFVTISMSFMGGAMTIRKAFFDPRSETVETWLAFFVASALAAVAVGRLDWLLLAYPLYVMTLSGLILLAIAAGRVRGHVHTDDDTTPERQQLTMSITSLERAGLERAGSPKSSVQTGS